jgi:hypothetical protein
MSLKSLGSVFAIVSAIAAVGVSASAMAIGVSNPNPQAQKSGVQVIQLNGAQCENDRNPTECELYFFSAKGRVLRVKLNLNERSYSYVSASNRTFRTAGASAEDLDILMRLGISLERMGIDCPSALVIDDKTKQIVQVVPGCDI